MTVQKAIQNEPSFHAKHDRDAKSKGSASDNVNELNQLDNIIFTPKESLTFSWYLATETLRALKNKILILCTIATLFIVALTTTFIGPTYKSQTEFLVYTNMSPFKLTNFDRREMAKSIETNFLSKGFRGKYSARSHTIVFSKSSKSNDELLHNEHSKQIAFATQEINNDFENRALKEFEFVKAQLEKNENLQYANQRLIQLQSFFDNIELKQHGIIKLIKYQKPTRVNSIYYTAITLVFCAFAGLIGFIMWLVAQPRALQKIIEQRDIETFRTAT